MMQKERYKYMSDVNAIAVSGKRKKLPFKFKINTSWILRWLVKLSAFLTVGVLVALIAYIVIMGVPNITAELFEFEYTSKNGSVTHALVNTLIMVFMTLLMAVPIGIFSAIYMVEYSKKNNRFVKIVSITTETLAGIPSIVYGLFGYLMFNVTMKLSYSMIGGAMTMAIMVLPLVIRTTQESLLSVPDTFREGSFGLGAGKLRTVFKIILPSAAPGILAGIILSIGRIVGETAALIFTAGTATKIPESIFGSGRTLAVHMYALLNEGIDMEKAYATAVILLVLVIVINALSGLIMKKLGKDVRD